MAKDRLKRRIAEALTGESVREELVRIFAAQEAPQREPHAALHPILDNVKDPILTVGPDGLVQEANAAAARLLDAPVEEIVGHDVALFIPQLKKGAGSNIANNYLQHQIWNNFDADQQLYTP